MSKDEKSPINLWLAGTLKPTVFEGKIVEFIIRREMSDSTGLLQTGMFAVLAQEAVSLTLIETGTKAKRIGLISAEIFDAPAVGEFIQAHIKQGLVDTSVNLYNAKHHLIARVIFT